MRNYEINRVAVLIDVMTECLGCTADEILAGLQGFCIGEQEAGKIKEALNNVTRLTHSPIQSILEL